jgi:hypothetical protein
VYELLPDMISLGSDVESDKTAAPISLSTSLNNDEAATCSPSTSSMTTTLDDDDVDGDARVSDAIATFNDSAILSARMATGPPQQPTPTQRSADEIRFQGLLSKLADSARDAFLRAIGEFRDPVTHTGPPPTDGPLDASWVRFNEWVRAKYRAIYPKGQDDDMIRILESQDSVLARRISSLSGGGQSTTTTAHAKSASTDCSFNPKAREFLSSSERNAEHLFSISILDKIFPFGVPSPQTSSDGSPAM